MFYRLAAELIVVVHLVFIVFAVFGAVLVVRHRIWMALHVPAAVWSAWVALAGWRCPLTPLEKWLRVQGGAAGYEAGFIEHYLLAILYPTELTRELQIGLGLVVIAINVALYARALRGRLTLSHRHP